MRAGGRCGRNRQESEGRREAVLVRVDGEPYQACGGAGRVHCGRAGRVGDYSRIFPARVRPGEGCTRTRDGEAEGEQQARPRLHSIADGQGRAAGRSRHASRCARRSRTIHAEGRRALRRDRRNIAAINQARELQPKHWREGRERTQGDESAIRYRGAGTSRSTGERESDAVSEWQQKRRLAAEELAKVRGCYAAVAKVETHTT